MPSLLGHDSKTYLIFISLHYTFQWPMSGGRRDQKRRRLLDITGKANRMTATRLGDRSEKK